VRSRGRNAGVLAELFWLHSPPHPDRCSTLDARCPAAAAATTTDEKKSMLSPSRVRALPLWSMPCSSHVTSQNLAPIWLPHWPAWRATISRMVERRRRKKKKLSRLKKEAAKSETVTFFLFSLFSRNTQKNSVCLLPAHQRRCCLCYCCCCCGCNWERAASVVISREESRARAPRLKSERFSTQSDVEDEKQKPKSQWLFGPPPPTAISTPRSRPSRRGWASPRRLR